MTVSQDQLASGGISFCKTMKKVSGPYLIVWTDAYTASDEWYDYASLKKVSKPYIVKTVGYVFDKEVVKGYVTVVSSIGKDNMFFSVLHIPKGMIIKKKKIT